jgi:hypothetical protein
MWFSLSPPVISPYLEGFHLILAKHLPQRDHEVWKHSDKTWSEYINSRVHQGVMNDTEAGSLLQTSATMKTSHPVTFKPTQHLRDDIFALQSFFSINEPPKIQDRSTKVQVVRYGFGDASRSGFGSITETSERVRFRLGVWGYDDNEESLNYKEFENAVSTIEDELGAGSLTGSTLYFSLTTQLSKERFTKETHLVRNCLSSTSFFENYSSTSMVSKPLSVMSQVGE